MGAYRAERADALADHYRLNSGDRDTLRRMARMTRDADTEPTVWMKADALAQEFGVRLRTLEDRLRRLHARGLAVRLVEHPNRWERQRWALRDGAGNPMLTARQLVAEGVADVLDNAPAEPVDNSAPSPRIDEPLAHGFTSSSPRIDVLQPTAIRGLHREGVNTGEEEEEVARARPAARCARHVNDVEPPPCRGCRDARLAAEAFDAADAERAEAERRRRADALTDPAVIAPGIEALRRRIGERYSAEAITRAAEAQMPTNLAVGLRLLDASIQTAEDAESVLGRWAP